MDFDLITNYDVKPIINFLDNNPSLWDKDPDIDVHNAPNYKSLNHKYSPSLDLLIDPIVEDLVKIMGGKLVQRSITLLPAQEDIREHSDAVNDLRRFHIPITTNEDVIFKSSPESKSFAFSLFLFKNSNLNLNLLSPNPKLLPD